jgi:predicted acetyltransferase
VALEAEVVLEVAKSGDAALLSNLLELYIHDLSATFDVELGPDGRFGYDALPRYWSEPERHFPFLIRRDARPVGFVLARRGSPVSDDPDVFDVAEFFVARRHRRSGVGRRAAALLWQRLPGAWLVRASERNPGACVFWRNVIGELTGGSAAEIARTVKDHPWRFFSFASAG